MLLFYALFHYSPMYGLIIAFKDYNVFKGILGSPWAGLYNFELVFGDDYFWKVVRNTAIISLLKLGFGFPAPIIIALLLNEVLYMGFKRVIRTIIYLPHFISWVILAGIMINILSIHGGLVNEIVELFGGTPQSYLMKPDYFRPIVTMSHIWKNRRLGLDHLPGGAGRDQRGVVRIRGDRRCGHLHCFCEPQRSSGVRLVLREMQAWHRSSVGGSRSGSCRDPREMLAWEVHLRGVRPQGRRSRPVSPLAALTGRRPLVALT